MTAWQPLGWTSLFLVLSFLMVLEDIVGRLRYERTLFICISPIPAFTIAAIGIHTMTNKQLNGVAAKLNF